MAKKDSAVLEPPLKHQDSKHHHGLKGGEPQFEEEPAQQPQEEEAPAPEQPLIVTPAAPVVTPFAGPPLLGKVPTNVQQLMQWGGAYAQLTPRAAHFAGPVVSGPTPGGPFPLSQVAGSLPQVAGSAILSLPLYLDGSMGNFNLPVTLPPGSFPYGYASMTLAAWTATPPSISLGSQSAAVDMLAAVAFPAVGLLTQGALLGPAPVWGASSPKVPWQFWLNVTANAAGTGQGVILIFYVRVPAPWN